MNFLYEYYHNLAERVKFGKWQLILLPVLFSIVGVYVGISTLDRDFIPFKSFAIENMLMPLVFFAVGFLFPVALWRRYAIRFRGQQFFWNKDGFSYAFLLLLFAIFLQIFAIWGDRSWDKIPIYNERLGFNGYYTEAQLRSIDENSYSSSADITLAKSIKYNGITQLRRQLSVFSRPFQVGEFVKIFLMIFTAKLIADMKMKGQMRLCKDFFTLPFLAILPIGFFTYLMPNYSMVIIYVLIIFLILFLQEMNLMPRFLMLIAIAIPIVIIFSIANLDRESYFSKIHGFNRIWNFFNEEGTGNDQQNEALQALKDGGIIGKGLDKGTIKLRLFGARNDFAYSILGEELGMWLMLPITIAMFGFLFACFWVAAGINGAEGKSVALAQNIAWGIAIIFTLNILFHIGVNLRLLPNTGQPLSFISSGGANLAMNFFLLGMLVQVSSLRRDAV
jgi:cell division protein FtsW (lipid II flippase)